MTERERKIVKAILDALHGLDGGQLTEPTLHAEANLKIIPNASRDEFENALKCCDDRGWVTGIERRFGGGKLWVINDAGEAARLQLK